MLIRLWKRGFRRFPQLAFGVLLGLLLFLLPYLLWGINTIADYYLAAVFALLLAGASAFGLFFWLSRGDQARV